MVCTKFQSLNKKPLAGQNTYENKHCISKLFYTVGQSLPNRPEFTYVVLYIPLPFIFISWKILAIIPMNRHKQIAPNSLFWLFWIVFIILQSPHRLAEVRELKIQYRSPRHGFEGAKRRNV